uniref:RHS repeat protein n=1 Tax=Macrostomum lignano TaxID=282301 RepID=A0A1I8JPH2_9PLAT
MSHRQQLQPRQVDHGVAAPGWSLYGDYLSEGPPSGGNYRHSHNNSYQAAVSDTETDPNRRYQPLAHFEWSQGTTFRVDQGRHFGSRGRHFRMMSSGATLGVGRALLSDGVTGHHFRVESGATFESEAARHFRMEQLAPLWESAGATYWMESGAHFRDDKKIPALDNDKRSHY